jgi:hypothetical protein
MFGLRGNLQFRRSFSVWAKIMPVPARIPQDERKGLSTNLDHYLYGGPKKSE